MDLTKMQIIRSAEDVTEMCARDAEQVFNDWFDYEEPIDWWSFFDRLETYGWSLEQVDSPAARKIRSIVRKFRDSSN